MKDQRVAQFNNLKLGKDASINNDLLETNKRSNIESKARQ